VRFRVEGDLGRASICHCRMCQKAFGGFFGPLVTAPDGGLIWTRGAPKRFASSDKVQRGFCDTCGTTLTYEWEGANVELAIGAFDAPADIVPSIQIGRESALPYVEDLAQLPGLPPEEAAAAESRVAKLRSHQHPDHDTAAWLVKR
jgi:hypothetical protein